jgi:hypothetical protein
MPGIVWDSALDALQGFYKSGVGTVEIVPGGYDPGYCLHTRLTAAQADAGNNGHAGIILDADDQASYTNHNPLSLTIGHEYFIRFRCYLTADWAPDTALSAGSGGNELIWQIQALPDEGEDYRSPVVAIYIDGYNRPTDPRYNLVVRYDEGSYTAGFNGTEYHFFGNPLDDAGAWVNWICHVKLDYSSAGSGFTRLYRKDADVPGDTIGDYTLVVSHDGPNCSNDTRGPDTYVGVYFWSWKDGVTGTLSEREYYWDDIRVVDVTAGGTWADIAFADDPAPEVPEPEEPVFTGDAVAAFAVASVACPTSVGQQTITTEELGGATPQAALLVLSGATADDTVAAHAQLNIGATDGTHVWCTSWCSEDAQERTDLYATTQDSHLLLMQAPTDGATLAVADLVGFVSGGITINWTDAPPSGYVLKVYLWAGIAGAQVGLLTTDADQNDAATATLGFRPQALLLSSLFATSEAQAAAANLALGLAVDDGSASQACVALWASDNADTSYARGGVWQGRALKYQSGWAGQVGFATDGFTLTTVDAAGAAVLVGYLALRYGDEASVALQVRASKTTTGDQATTGVGFQPHHVLGVYSFADAVDTYIYGDHGISSLGIGGATAGAEGSVSVLHAHGQATSLAKSKADAKLCNLMALNAGDGLEAALTSMDADGYTLGYSVANATARYSIELLAYLPEEVEEEEPPVVPATLGSTGTYPPAVEYQVRLRQADGALLAVLAGDAHGGSPDRAGYLALQYRKMVNAPGLLSLTLNAESEAAALLGVNTIVEVWRRDLGQGIPWTRDFTGLVRRRQYRYAERHTLVATCPGPLYLLGTRHVYWPAGTTNRSQFTGAKAETIAKTLVAYNAGAEATVANGRLREGAITGLTVTADGAGGNTLDWYCAYDNLLATLQDLAQVGGGDFDLVQGEGAAWEFRWYAGQRGTDRSASVIFALEWGNMAEPVYEDNRLEERNVVAALGQGEGAARSVVIRSEGDADSETTIDARNEASAAGLQARADAALRDRTARQTFTFKALQTPSCLYGRDYFLGDLVTARYGSVYAATRKIVGVTVSLAPDGAETITPEFGEAPA